MLALNKLLSFHATTWSVSFDALMSENEGRHIELRLDRRIKQSYKDESAWKVVTAMLFV